MSCPNCMNTGGLCPECEKSFLEIVQCPMCELEDEGYSDERWCAIGCPSHTCEQPIGGQNE